MMNPSPYPTGTDYLLPTDNTLEIPTLSLELQPKNVEIPVLCYGEQRRSKDMRSKGILHFYTDDYRWTSVANHPEKIMRHNPGCAVELNFSLFNDTPIAFGMQLLYKKRWTSRALQEIGIPVFVDLNVANKWYELNLVGVPKGYGAFATRGYSDRMAALEYEYELASRVADGNLRFFLVYGGGKDVRDWCMKHRCAYYITPTITIKNRIKAIEQMKANTVAVSSLESSLPIKANASEENLFEQQIMNNPEL